MKKYWTHILNLTYLALIDAFIGFLLFGMANAETIDASDGFGIGLVFILIEAILTVCVLAEMVYTMVKAGQDKKLENKPLHIVAMYCLNIYYIPCFMMSYVHKDERAKEKNIAYIVLSVSLTVLLVALYIGFVLGRAD